MEREGTGRYRVEGMDGGGRVGGMGFTVRMNPWEGRKAWMAGV